jgi:hypothetical protein
MALKPCEACRHALRSEDKVCPHCGSKQSAAKSHLAKGALILLALGLGVWVFDATSTREPQRQIAAAARATPAPKPVAVLSDAERVLQERCGRQTDENGNWIVKGAEDRARCRVQVELEMERNEREVRAIEKKDEARAPAEPLTRELIEAPRVAHLTRAPKASRARFVKHESAPRSVSAPTPAASPSASVENERLAPAKEAASGPIGPGDDLKPLVPASGALSRDPVPGEPMTVRPDAAFL